MTTTARTLLAACLATLLLSLCTHPAPATAQPLDRCSWSRPGADRYLGDPGAAIMAMADMPLVAREALRERVWRRDRDGWVVITRDAVESPEGTLVVGNLRDMNFGRGRVCRGEVDRSGWLADARQKADVYTVTAQDGRRWAVLIAWICGNVMRGDVLHADQDRPIDASPAAGLTPGQVRAAQREATTARAAEAVGGVVGRVLMPQQGVQQARGAAIRVVPLPAALPLVLIALAGVFAVRGGRG